MTSYRGTVLATAGLVGYWPLNEPSGATANDLFGSNDGTTTGATLGASGIVTNTGDTCYSFDGDGDIVNVGTHAEFDTDAVSFECWFSWTGSWAASRPLVAYRVAAGGAGGWVFQSDFTPGQFNFYVSTGGGFFFPLLTTGWTADTVWHVVGVYDSTTHRVYRNGVLLDNSDGVNDPLDQPSSLVLAIGKSAHADATHLGLIADVSVYNLGLSDATVLAHYNAGVNAPESGYGRLRAQFQLRPY